MLYRSDGTEAGTAAVSGPLFVEMLPNASSFVAPGVALNGSFYFLANESTSALKLWKSDQSDTTAAVSDFSGVNGLANLTVAGQTLFFTAGTHQNFRQLWKSDGTAEGTVALVDPPGAPWLSFSISRSRLMPVGEFVYFLGVEQPAGDLFHLWKTDGTPEGTTQLTDDTNLPGRILVTASWAAANGAIYFGGQVPGSGEELWRSNGTHAGTALLKDINATVTLNSMSSPSFVDAGNGVVYFAATRADTGLELWRSDGTAAGTSLIKDINPGIAGSSPNYFVRVGDFVYFTAQTAEHGTELWRTDGTPAGTYIVKDNDPGTGAGAQGPLTVVGGTVYFEDGIDLLNTRLMKSNGTVDGTVEVKTFTPPTGGGSNFIGDMVEFNGQLVLAVGDYYNQKLYKSNGTAAGTTIIDGLGAATGVSDLTVANNLIFFQREASGDLWATNGNAAGTYMVAKINTAGGSEPRDLTEYNGVLYFWAASVEGGRELWKSNGNSGGTMMVKDIVPGNGSSAISSGPLIAGPGGLYFSASTPETGYALWRTDGSTNGTQMVVDLHPSTSSGSLYSPLRAVSLNGRLFFAGVSDTSGGELYATDGTANGTVRVAEIAAGAASSSPDNLLAVGDRLFFTANDLLHGVEPWVYAPPTLDLPGEITTSQAAIFRPTFTFADPGTPPSAWIVTATFSDAGPATDLTVGPGPSFTLLRNDAPAGDYSIMVTLSDGAGGFATDTINVHLAPPPGGVVVAAASGYYLDGDRLVVTDGHLTFTEDADLTGTDVVVTGQSYVVFDGATPAARSITVTDNASAFYQNFSGHTLKIGRVAMGPAAIYDLYANALAVTDMTADEVRALLVAGYDNGSWRGAGGISSTNAGAVSGDPYSVGYATAAQILDLATGQTGVWRSQTVSAESVLVRFTYGGDANLDGKIDIDDYGIIDFSVTRATGPFNWFDGDFNYDGKINIDDYGIIDFNVGRQTGTL